MKNHPPKRSLRLMTNRVPTPSKNLTRRPCLQWNRAIAPPTPPRSRICLHLSIKICAGAKEQET